MKNFKMLIALVLSLMILGSGCVNSRETTTAVETEQSSTEEITQAPSLNEDSSLLDLTEKLDEDYQVRDEVRQILDNYEEYVDKYCAFMLEYMNADTNTQLANMAKYTEFNQTIAQAQTYLQEALQDPDTLWGDEYDYIILVQTRTAQKLLQAATEGLNGE